MVSQPETEPVADNCAYHRPGNGCTEFDGAGCDHGADPKHYRYPGYDQTYDRQGFCHGDQKYEHTRPMRVLRHPVEKLLE